MKIIPIEGRLIRDPETGREIKNETEVPETGFWLRRLADGDVAMAASTDKKTKGE